MITLRKKFISFEKNSQKGRFYARKQAIMSRKQTENITNHEKITKNRCGSGRFRSKMKPGIVGYDASFMAYDWDSPIV